MGGEERTRKGEREGKGALVLLKGSRKYTKMLYSLKLTMVVHYSYGIQGGDRVTYL